MKRDFQSSLIVGLALTLGVIIAAFVGFFVFLEVDAHNVTFARLPSRSMKNAIVEVNGRLLREPYATLLDSIDPVADDFRWQRAYVIGPAALDTVHYVASRNNWGPLVVPKDDYFVLGDLRDESLDSRYFGFVTARQMIGRVRRVYFSRDDSTGEIPWSRIGRLVR